MKTKEKLSPAELERALKHFYGSIEYTQHSLDGLILLTEGAKFLADHAGAYWLMDIIWSVYPKLREGYFHVLTLTAEAKKGLVRITDTDEDGEEVEIYRQEIEYTDFPLPEQKLFIGTADYDSRKRPIKVVMLPMEY